MKNINLKFGVILAIGLILFSCKKEEEIPVTATINFTEPAVNDTIVFGSEVHIEGTISGSAEMHGYTVTAVNNSNQAVLLSKSYTNHASSYNFHEHFVNNVTEITNVKVKVDVEKDHDGNHEIKEVNIVCLPQ